MIAMRNVATHLLEVVDPAEVVDESGGVERVEAGEAAEAGGVVVVAVDAEDGQLDVEVGVGVVDVFAPGAVGKVDRGVAHQPERDGTISVHMLS